MKKGNLLITGMVLVMISILGRLYIGVYYDEEFPEKHLFLKHRPTWKWSFHSPIGMSDLKKNNLDTAKLMEENYYDEFVRRN